MTRDWPFELKLTRKFQIRREKVFVMHCFVWWFLFSRGFLGFVGAGRHLEAELAKEAITPAAVTVKRAFAALV